MRIIVTSSGEPTIADSFLHVLSLAKSARESLKMKKPQV
jgi:hypothetical protein